MQVQSCCFAYSNNCFFDVLVVVAVVTSLSPYYCQECITNGLFPHLELFPQNLGAIGRCACANVPRSQFRPQGFSIRFHGKCSGTRLKLPILRSSSWKRGCLLPWAY